ncbi:hypothetical protein CEXT_38561 [Caerostris extrusa]|uniref:Uncharacterized protein n=1 Tax=Caerostris extrusa TaxID=172846 RepID=A0AAV4VS95_CAEEX|nr:hypothetical protein CEXT_38561 [Caerostris extrusa]
MKSVMRGVVHFGVGWLSTKSLKFPNRSTRELMSLNELLGVNQSARNHTSCSKRRRCGKVVVSFRKPQMEEENLTRTPFSGRALMEEDSSTHNCTIKVSLNNMGGL